MRRKCCKIASIILIYICCGVWGAYPFISEFFVPPNNYFYAKYTQGEHKLLKLYNVKNSSNQRQKPRKNSLDPLQE